MRKKEDDDLVDVDPLGKFKDVPLDAHTRWSLQHAAINQSSNHQNVSWDFLLLSPIRPLLSPFSAHGPFNLIHCPVHSSSNANNDLIPTANFAIFLFSFLAIRCNFVFLESFNKFNSQEKYCGS